MMSGMPWSGWRVWYNKGMTGNKYPQELEREFDFHGMTTMECKIALDELVKSRTYDHVRIIVGRGTNSPNGPVLPNFVKSYLVQRGIRFSQSKVQDGGEGALEVWFR